MLRPHATPAMHAEVAFKTHFFSVRYDLVLSSRLRTLNRDIGTGVTGRVYRHDQGEFGWVRPKTRKLSYTATILWSQAARHGLAV